MANLTATYGAYVISIGDGGKVLVTRDGQVCGSAMGALREIAVATGFVIDPKWNTQSSGKKLVAFLNSGSPAAAPAVVTAPAVAPEPASAVSEPPQPVAPSPEVAAVPERPSKSKSVEETITLTPDDMNRILRKLDELENKLDRLASAPAVANVGEATAVAAGEKERIIKEFHVPRVLIYKHDDKGNQEGSSICCLNSCYIMQTSGGRFLQRGNFAFGYNSNANSMATTAATLREFAEGLGLTVDKDAKRLTIAMQIINRFGHLVNGAYVHGDGDLYTYRDFNFEEYVGALTNQDLLANQYTNEAMKVDPAWSKEELLQQIIRFIGSLNSKYGY